MKFLPILFFVIAIILMGTQAFACGKDNDISKSDVFPMRRKEPKVHPTLWSEVEKGNLSEVEKLLKENPGLLKEHYNSFTLLHSAAYGNRKDIVKYLIDHDQVDVNAKDNQGDTPLHWAACGPYGGNYKEVIDILISSGARLNGKENCGRTPLQISVHTASKEAVELLIKRGADVNSNSIDGATPLHDAARAGRSEIVSLLISQGAKVSARNKLGETPLHHSTSCQVLSILIESGAEVNAKNGKGETPLYKFAPNEKFAAVLIASGARVNEANKAGFTPLFNAVKANSLNAVKFLVSHGATVNIKNKIEDRQFLCNDTMSCYAPLHLAAYYGHKDIVVHLVSSGARVNAKDANGRTPLNVALYRTKNEVASYLRAHGGKV